MKIHYTVSMGQPATHYFRVAMRLEGLRGALPSDLLRLAMPVWTPGSYSVRDFSRNVLDLEAVDASGKRLQVERDAKDSWVVSLAGSDALEVTYRVYAFRHDTSQSYLDSDHAIINGASVFLYVDGEQSHPLTLEVVPHEGWSVVATGLEPLVPGGWTFAAPNYDVLVDSPVEVGAQLVHSFEVRGVTHQVSIFAAKPIDEATFVADIKRIVEHTIPIFGEVPYSRYVFLVDFTDQGYGGLEHLNSTHCIAGYLMMEPPSEYRRLLALFSHEFFHTWNVKRMRPVALGPFDYSRENYTKSLWISEGITSYFENVILRRAEIVTAPEYLDFICDDISEVKSLPSSRSQTPEESSFDTWIKLYREDENSPNVSPSYYRQGAVLGTLLDLEIRRSTGGAKALDDVMRRVYSETYKAGRGFTDDEFERACTEVSGGAAEDLQAIRQGEGGVRSRPLSGVRGAQAPPQVRSLRSRRVPGDQDEAGAGAHGPEQALWDPCRTRRHLRRRRDNRARRTEDGRAEAALLHLNQEAGDRGGGPVFEGGDHPAHEGPSRGETAARVQGAEEGGRRSRGEAALPLVDALRLGRAPAVRGPQSVAGPL